jgi:hypothetical protein
MIRLPRRPARHLALLALATGVLLVPAAPASAAAPVVDLNCTITVTTDIHPPLTPRLQNHAFVSHGLTGTATCTGTINGQPVTGPGSFAISDQVVSDCTQAHGAGTFVLKIPTAGGTKTVAGRTTIVVTAGITVHSGDLTGTATVIAANGDCVTTPITSATARLTVHVT